MSAVLGTSPTVQIWGSSTLQWVYLRPRLSGLRIVKSGSGSTLGLGFLDYVPLSQAVGLPNASAFWITYR
ncbi:hypothetical protein RRG08_048559 [Elysia crispata]|uniref:Uncharacterized protein n=1 Tax=Elysia crispata TaxID=231223 RepID=A0AAE1B6G3_9GAST|nr:hypothetical protein RRG08_048559 [Elysia crispata]